MDEAYELALAKEGEGAAAYSEDQWIAWEEQLALAPDLAAKKRLVHGAFGATTPDYAFRAALCSLLEVQELLDAKTSEGDAAVDALLQSEKAQLLNRERELSAKGFWRKATRVGHRRAVLELEIATRLAKPEATIKELSRAVATAMGLTLSDPAPTIVETQAAPEAPMKTALTDDEISTETKVLKAVQLLQHYTDEHLLKQRARSELENMRPFARELFFALIVRDSTSWAANPIVNTKWMLSSALPAVNLNSDQRWWMLELFLDEFTFECADVEGYTDVIVEDLKRNEGEKKKFGSRDAHGRLSLSQLQSLLNQHSSLVGDDETFAARYIYFMLAEHKIDQESEIDQRDEFNRALRVAALEQILEGLTSFSASANTFRAWILHEQLRELQYDRSIRELAAKFVQYISLPRFGCEVANAAYIRSVKADELVVFEEPAYTYRYSDHTQPSTPLRVNQVSSTLGDCEVKAKDDLNLIKSILFIWWSSGKMTVEDETSIRKYLSAEFVDAEKAECMVVSGCGDLSVWKPKLPQKGAELSQWSSHTEISFCTSSPSYFSPEDEMKFFVNVRNVKTLTVQVYEVRTVDYYARVRSEVQGDICLDGLLPNEEQVVDLSHLLPWQKARIPVKVSPTATRRRGVFVVELFEKDTSCRAVLRKGHLRHVQRVTSRGIEFTVLNEQGEVLPGATAMLINLKNGSSKAQPPRCFTPADSTSAIVVPFRQADASSMDKFGIIFQYGDFGYLMRGFDYTDASFSLEAQMYIDHEQLRPGEEATLVVRPILSVGSGVKHIVSVQMLTDVKVTVKFSSVNRESSAAVGQKKVREFDSIDDLMQGRCTFTIPLDAEEASIEIRAKVKIPSASEPADVERLPTVTSSKQFAVQRVAQFEETYSPHFLRRVKETTALGAALEYEYFIAVLGHNGERIKGKGMTISASHTHFNTLPSFSLESDEHGEIKLGKLEYIEEISASFSGSYRGENTWTWELPNLRTHTPQMINCCTNESVRIPLPIAFSSYIENWIEAGMLSLYRVLDLSASVDTPVLEQVGHKTTLSCVKNSTGQAVGVSFRPDRIGNYIVLVRTLNVRYPITVCKVKRPIVSIGSSGLLIQQKKILLATPTRPLMILGYTLESLPNARTSLLIQLDESKAKSTQVWVILKQSLDKPHVKLTSNVKANGLSNGNGNHFLKDLAFESSLHENEYLKKRKISDEYTYILQRRAFVKSNPSSLMLLGATSLPRPTLVQTPHVVDESDMEALVMRAGEKVSGFKTSEDRTSRSRSAMLGSERHHLMARVTRKQPGSSISFFAKSSATIACSAVDDDGIARVCLSDISLFADAERGNLELVILAFDVNNGQVASFESQISTATKGGGSPKRDVRLASEEALKNDEPSMQLQCHEVLSGGQSRILPRTFSSKYALYENLQSAMDLWSTLCTDQNVPGLVAKLKSWSTMTLKAKISFYLKNMCDDLNFFVYQKDRAFFNDHVKPYLSVKVSPSMIDLYVLEDFAAMTKRYAHPAAFQRLSVIEKLLVAERSTSIVARQAMCQHVVDLIEGACLADSAVGHQLSRIFDTVLSQGAVKPDLAIQPPDEIVDAYGSQPPDSTASFGAPQPSVIAFSLSCGSSAFGSAGAMQQQQQQQQQTFGGSGAGNDLRRLAASYSPSSPAYSPTSPAYMPTSGSYAQQAAPVPMAATLMSKKRMSFHKIERSGDPSDSSDDDDDDEDDSDFGVQSLHSDDEAKAEEEEDRGEGDEGKISRKAEAVKRRAKPYVLAGKVRRIQEKRYFSCQKPPLDGRNLFWRDYAKHVMQQAASKEQQFLSSHFPEALRFLTEGIFALSLLDFAQAESTPTSIRLIDGGHRVELNASTDVVLYHQGIGRGSVAKEPNSVLVVKQRLVSLSDLSSTSRDFADIQPAHEFLVNRIYTCVVSVSNIGSTRLKNVNLLRQIPRGSIPLTSDSFYTKNEVIEIAPHDTRMYTCNFYFPEVGQFTQYPAHVSLDGEIVAWASTDEQFTNPIVVVLNATAVDMTSWSDVAARGTLQDAITFMNGKSSLAVLDLSALAWRCQDTDFYAGLVDYLRTRWVFADSIWKYAFLHNDTQGIQEVTSSREDFLRSLGAGIHTAVVQLCDIYHQERFDSGFGFDHTEFGPLLSRRVHRVSGKVESLSISPFGSSDVITAAADEPARVLHKKAREYYRTLCHVLSILPTLTADHLLVVTYFLIIFQRTADALKLFERVKTLKSSEMRDTDEFSIVADYIDSYLDFFRLSASEQGKSRFPVARRNVVKYSKLTNERWYLRFLRVQELLDEYDELHAAAEKRVQVTTIGGSTMETTKKAIQRVPDDQEVRLDAAVKGDEIHFTSQHLGSCEISFYRIDVELMFSTEPFDSFSGSAASKSSLLLIKPWRQMRVELTEAAISSAGSLVSKIVRLPPDLAASPMLLRIREIESTRTIESVAAPIDLTRSYFNSQLQVVVTKQAGLVQVLHNGLPVPSCYVKVYVKANGSGMSARGTKAQFYKDGYTDVIGRFDYASINGDLLSRVEKFSLLVSHPTLGTSVEQVAPPVLAVTSSEFTEREALEALWY